MDMLTILLYFSALCYCFHPFPCCFYISFKLSGCPHLSLPQCSVLLLFVFVLTYSFKIECKWPWHLFGCPVIHKIRSNPWQPLCSWWLFAARLLFEKTFFHFIRSSIAHQVYACYLHLFQITILLHTVISL